MDEMDAEAQRHLPGALPAFRPRIGAADVDWVTLSTTPAAFHFFICMR
jgi:hypothetical protein